jgi:hypothetical protein
MLVIPLVGAVGLPDPPPAVPVTLVKRLIPPNAAAARVQAMDFDDVRWVYE